METKEIKSSSPNSISVGQLAIFVLQTQIGIGILSLPYAVFKVAGSDGWMSVLIGGLFVQVMIVVIWVLCNRFPGSTLFEFIPKILGGLVGTILSLAYIFYFIAMGSLILILYGHIVKLWTFPNTPSWIIFASIVFSAIYLVKENLRIIARYHMLVSFSFIILIFLSLGIFRYLNVLYIMPLGGSGVLSIIKGSKEALLSTLGFELLLLLYPLTQGKNIQRVKAVSLANLGVTIFYTFITITTFMFFSPEEMKIVPEPVLYVLKALEFTVLERLDLFFLSVWILAVTTSFMSYLYIASYGITKILRMKHHKKVVPVVGAICFCIALIPGDNLLIIETWSKIIINSGLIFSVLIPILLLLLAILFRIKDGGNKS